ncbi:LysR family transcriptional regulator [Actinoplanes sp. L3-i22]|uniref:LysR family transcriptional regulator n=1 Tax=Actinoplanes sp. L3-i22 TaxID=2836373 RepID=UPI002105F9DD|nr:LysR family transcriptional regulator [Actinoplanes sp. L3-i22]
MRVPGSELDLRLVGYFTVVAEHGNFGRAAAALHVAQPSLSRQIQRLEEHLGVRLLERTPQGSRLTDAGRAFLPQARELLGAAQRATVAAREAAAPRELTIGYLGNLVITPAVSVLRRRHPDARIRTRHLRCTDGRALPERRVDTVVLYTPIPFATEHLRVTELYAERRVAVLPAGHRLAGKESITIGDLTGEAFPTCAAASSAWNGFARLEPRAGGVAVLDAPAVYESFEDTLELVAAGESVLVVPAGDHRPAAHPHLATVPLADAEPTHVVVASRNSDTNPLLTEFLAVAAATLTAA